MKRMGMRETHRVKQIAPVNWNFIIIAGILTGTFILCLYLCMIAFPNKEEANAYNKARILLGEDVYQVTSWMEDGQAGEPRLEHAGAVFDLSGIALYSNDSEYQKGEKYNVSELLQIDQAFVKKNGDVMKLSFPILQQEQTVGFAVFQLERNQLMSSDAERMLHCFLPLAVWAVLALLLGAFAVIRWNKTCREPMEQMIDSSKAIIEGDYSREILQKRSKAQPSGELEQLVYQFEMMRDELRTKAAREEELKRSQKELMSCMSHDLRTPIATIQAHAEAIRDGIVVEEEKKQQYIDTIIRKSIVLNKMIADLLDHSNAEVNQLKITLQECYFRQYMDSLAKELEIYCKKNDSHFQYENDCPELLVLMDKDRITQVIYNLVENACKYRRHDGNEGVAYECKVCLQAIYNKENNRIFIHVSDNGSGIEMTDIPYVFDRFYRAEKSRSMSIPGAGLGLSICRYIIEQHGGEISLESRKGIGTTVSFYLNF